MENNILFEFISIFLSKRWLEISINILNRIKLIKTKTRHYVVYVRILQDHKYWLVGKTRRSFIDKIQK